MRRSVARRAPRWCASRGDKLLGGPQAGLIVGRADGGRRRAARHPLARALRIDKLSLAALEATLRLHRDPARAAEIPVLAMLTRDAARCAARAERLAAAIGRRDVVAATARVGGGALPLLELPGPVVALAGRRRTARRRACARGDPPVVGRIEDGRLLLDPRTLTDEEAEPVAAVVGAALAAR